MLSIEELADLTVTSPTRRPERVQDTPSAISVVTAEDIRRSGATTLTDSLRLATGVHVAQANSNTWAVGIRGFNLTTTNKLLVLQDGRSLYSPLYSGVFWDVQDPMIEDIERIEVIRGPGATMWGANAVNGVINVITRDAEDTQGALVVAGTGNRERGYGAARYGGKAGKNTWYRVYGRGWDREEMVTADGRSTDERRRFGQGGFRIDSKPAPEITWTLQGDLYDGRFEERDADPTDVSGANLLGRWTRSSGKDRHLSIQTYYDRVERQIPDTFGENRDTFDIQLQQRFPVGDRHDFIWGGEIFLSQDEVDNSDRVAFVPDRETIRTFSGFIQDTISIVPDHLEWTIGSKFEHHTYSGFEYQPSTRLAWMPDENQTIWASLSRATRAPSRIDTDVRFLDNGDLILRGDRDFQSERLIAYEVGYRVRPVRPLTLDLALFYNDYSRLRSLEGQDPVVLGNLLKGQTYGFEVSANFSVKEWWRLSGGYSRLHKRLGARSDSTDDPGSRDAAEGNDPRHIFFVHSAMDLADDWTFDSILRHVSSLPAPSVPSYTELDLRLAYQVNPALSLALTGRNLLDSSHREFGTTREVPRSYFFRIEWTR